jgi:hypothetical protein
VDFKKHALSGKERTTVFFAASPRSSQVLDQCVYTKGTGAAQLIVCTWVDDMILASSRDNEAGRLQFDAALRKEFEMSPWTSGEANWVLNMKATCDWVGGTIRVSQPGAIEKLPMDPMLKLTKPDAAGIVPASEWDYQSAVGAMLYLSLTARPDVAQCVGVLSRFMSCPGRIHVEATKQCIVYSKHLFCLTISCT